MYKTVLVSLLIILFVVVTSVTIVIIILGKPPIKNLPPITSDLIDITPAIANSNFNKNTNSQSIYGSPLLNINYSGYLSYLEIIGAITFLDTTSSVATPTSNTTSNIIPNRSIKNRGEEVINQNYTITIVDANNLEVYTDTKVINSNNIDTVINPNIQIQSGYIIYIYVSISIIFNVSNVYIKLQPVTTTSQPQNTTYLPSTTTSLPQNTTTQYPTTTQQPTTTQNLTTTQYPTITQNPTTTQTYMTTQYPTTTYTPTTQTPTTMQYPTTQYPTTTYNQTTYTPTTTTQPPTAYNTTTLYNTTPQTYMTTQYPTTTQTYMTPQSQAMQNIAIKLLKAEKLPLNWNTDGSDPTTWTNPAGIIFNNKLITQINLMYFIESVDISIFTDLYIITSLTSIDLSQCELSGTLPDSWSSLTLLQYLGLSYNQLSGPLPSSWSSMTLLTYLNLFSNELTGTLPISWSSLTLLNTLDLAKNQVTGHLPDSWSSMTQMNYLALFYNQLTGSLPDSWAGMTNLQYLWLYNNQLTGTLPISWSSMTNLQYLFLYDNQLTGTLPSSWSSMILLTRLVISPQYGVTPFYQTCPIGTSASGTFLTYEYGCYTPTTQSPTTTYNPTQTPTKYPTTTQYPTTPTSTTTITTPVSATPIIFTTDIKSILYSSNGSSWNVINGSSLLPLSYINGISYNFPTVVAVGHNSLMSATVLIYSNDYGTTWNEVSTPSSSFFGSVVYTNQKFITLFSDPSSTTIIYSDDGSNWNQINSISTFLPDGRDVCYSSLSAKKMYVAVGGGKNQNNIVYSPDCITWKAGESFEILSTDQQSPPPLKLDTVSVFSDAIQNYAYCITCGIDPSDIDPSDNAKSLFIVGCYGYDPIPYALIFSNNGINWWNKPIIITNPALLVDLTVSAIQIVYSLCWSPVLKLFVGSFMYSSYWNCMAYSDNGVTWTNCTYTGWTVNSIYWSNSLNSFFASAYQRILSSSDGKNWNITYATNESNYIKITGM